MCHKGDYPRPASSPRVRQGSETPALLGGGGVTLGVRSCILILSIKGWDDYSELLALPLLTILVFIIPKDTLVQVHGKYL